jgi:hypothetical protein
MSKKSYQPEKTPTAEPRLTIYHLSPMTGSPEVGIWVIEMGGATTAGSAMIAGTGVVDTVAGSTVP